MSGISSRNPFVGPRPIQRGERLHGRDVELRELYHRLQARRIVVLHSPSGAGKSSLVQAGLIPRLEANAFDVWTPIRLNLDPSGLGDVPEGTNRYLLSAMITLEDELPPEHRRSPRELAALSFAEYLRTRPRRKSRAGRNVVLLFDQFEEVLTAAPLAVAAKHELFAEVGRALDDESYWALFIIREDYLAALAPYRDKIPTQLGNTFRLDLLGLEGARDAAVELAAQGGRTFPGVDKLVHDLSMVQIQQADGSFVAEQGVHVEPVHLQVVGRRLWSAMPQDDLSIDAEDIEAYASVSEALGAYYADAVADIAGDDVATERAIRDWVGGKLVVGGIRSQVRREADASAGLDNRLIDALLGCYLVRTEQRAGASWFELSHDRLVEPVQRSNEAWERAHLHPLQVQAKLWEDGQRDRSLLLRPEGIPGAIKWAKENPERLTKAEHEFLKRSRRQRAEEIRYRTLVIVGFVATAAVAIFAFVQRSAANKAHAEARRRGELLHQALQTADVEARVGRDLRRLVIAESLTARAEVSEGDRATAAGLLAEVESDDMQAMFDERIPRRGWPLLLASVLGLPDDEKTLEQLSSLRAQELRALLWSEGVCPSLELRKELLWYGAEAAEARMHYCHVIDECWACRSEGCAADPTTLRLPPEQQLAFERCLDQARDEVLTLRHHHGMFDAELLRDDYLDAEEILEHGKALEGPPGGGGRHAEPGEE